MSKANLLLNMFDQADNDQCAVWLCGLLVVCVVETGSSKWQLKLSQKHAVQSTMNMPNMRISGDLAKGACLAMLLLMVSVTLAPRRRAPRNSQTAAIITA